MQNNRLTPRPTSTVTTQRRLLALILVLLCPSLLRAQQQQQPRPAHRDSADTRRTPAPARAIVGYFPQWGVYQHRFLPKDLVRTGAIRLLTQVDYAQTTIADNGCVVADPQADLHLSFPAADSIDGLSDPPTAPLRGDLHQFQLLHARFPAVRLLISIQGKQSQFEEAAKPEHRAAFVRSCISRWIGGHLAPGVELGSVFSGIDVDWEYPDSDHAGSFYALLDEFRRQMDALRPGLLLSIASSANTKNIAPIAWERVSAVVDQIGVMTYDFAGPWSHTTGFVAPLRSADPAAATVSTVIAAYRSSGVPARKLLLGVPFYAYQWHNVADGGAHGLNSRGDPLRGNRNQSTAAALLAGSPAAVLYRDPVSLAPWIYDGDNFLTFDDTVSLGAKVRFADAEHLGGVMIWELSGDTDDLKLLHALSSTPAPAPFKTGIAFP